MSQLISDLENQFQVVQDRLNTYIDNLNGLVGGRTSLLGDKAATQPVATAAVLV